MVFLNSPTCNNISTVASIFFSSILLLPLYALIIPFQGRGPLLAAALRAAFAAALVVATGRAAKAALALAS